MLPLDRVTAAHDLVDSGVGGRVLVRADMRHRDAHAARSRPHPGRVLADLVTALNPAVVVIGGELSTRVDAAGEPPVLAGVADAMNRYALPVVAASLDIRCATLAHEAELRGVLSLALDTAVASATLT